MEVIQGPQYVKTKATDLIITSRNGPQISQFQKQFQKPDPSHWVFLRSKVQYVPYHQTIKHQADF
jgi:hypothetical protein